MLEKNEQTERPKYWAFISYSHRDREFAAWLHRALEVYRIPRRSLIKLPDYAPHKNRLQPVFLDRAELSTTHDLTETLRQAMRESAWLIVICSPAAVESERVDAEIRFFKEIHGYGRVIPVIVSGRPNAAARDLDPTTECLPAALRAAEHGGDASAEPLAADARGGRRVGRDAVLRIAARLLDVEYDALVRRQLQRKVRALGVAAATALIVTALTAGLAFYAMRAEHRANLEAEVAEATTQFLVDVFNAPSPEMSGSSEVTATEMLDYGARRLQSDQEFEPEVRARVAEAMGRAYRHLGALEKAESLIKEAADYWRARGDMHGRRASAAYVSEALLLQDRDQRSEAAKLLREVVAAQGNGLTETYQAVPLVFLAEFEVRDANLERAEELLNRAEQLLESGDAISMAHAHLYGTYRDLFLEQARYAEAEAAAERNLEVLERLGRREFPAYARGLIEMGDLLSERGEPGRALPYYEQALELETSIYGAESRAVAFTSFDIGIALARQGRLEEAEPRFRAYLDYAVRELGSDHTSTGYAYYNYGNLLADLGRTEEAIDMIERSQSIWEQSQGDSHPDVAYALNLRANLLMKLDEDVEARPLIDRALEINRESFAPGHPNIARSMLNDGEWLMRQDRVKDAEPILREALDTMIGVFGADSGEVVRYRDAHNRALNELQHQGSGDSGQG